MFNPFEPDFAANPYPQYAVLREHDPVHRSLLGPWVLSRYDDVVRVLRDPSLSVEERNATRVASIPRSSRVRRAIGAGSRRSSTSTHPTTTGSGGSCRRRSPRRWSSRCGPRSSGSSTKRLRRGGARRRHGPDRRPRVPAAVHRDLRDARDADRPRDELRTWSHAVVKTLDPILTLDEAHAAADAADAMTEYVLEVIATKRAHPADDLLSALIAAEDDGDMLDEQELIDQVMLLYIAGHETTVNLIGNGTLALSAHRDQLDRLRDDPDLDQNAVEELLRFDSPVQFSRRIAVQDFELHGEIDRGGQLRAHLPRRREPRPGALGGHGRRARPRARRRAQHVSFGSGVHHCLGAALARVEGRAAFGALVRRFDELELVEDSRPGTAASSCAASTRSPLAFSVLSGAGAALVGVHVSSSPWIASSSVAG